MLIYVYFNKLLESWSLKLNFVQMFGTNLNWASDLNQQTAVTLAAL